MAGVSSRWLRTVTLAAARIEAQCPVCSAMDAADWLRIPVAQVESRPNHLPFGLSPFGVATLNFPGFPWNLCMSGHIWRADIKTRYRETGHHRVPTHITVEPYVLGITGNTGR